MTRSSTARRLPALALAVAAALAVSPVLLLTSCGDDDDEPGQPTITLGQETINPNVSVGSDAPAND
jgi:hypothetical protein